MGGFGVLDDWGIGVWAGSRKSGVGSRKLEIGSIKKSLLILPIRLVFLVNVRFVVQLFHINFLVINGAPCNPDVSNYKRHKQRNIAHGR